MSNNKTYLWTTCIWKNKENVYQYRTSKGKKPIRTIRVLMNMISPNCCYFCFQHLVWPPLAPSLPCLDFENFSLNFSSYRGESLTIPQQEQSLVRGEYVLDWIFLKLVFVSGWCPIHTLWIKVRCFCRSIYLLVCFLFQILVDHCCTVRSGIVIHQNEITNGANLWSYNRCNDLIYVADTGKKSVPYDKEVFGTIVTYACPNQVWHTTKPVMFRRL